MSLVRGRDGATPSDVLIFLATISLAAALLYPAWSAREFRERVAGVVGDVEALRSAARSALDLAGAWPSATEPGTAPPEMIGLSREGGVFDRPDYTLQWTSWNVVDSIVVAPDAAFLPGDAPPDSVGPRLEPIVRSVGGIAVHSGDAALLAELAEHYEEETSFVLDTVWLLVLPERGSPPLDPSGR
jgi:hypothetical protein